MNSECPYIYVTYSMPINTTTDDNNMYKFTHAILLQSACITPITTLQHCLQKCTHILSLGVTLNTNISGVHSPQEQLVCSDN